MRIGLFVFVLFTAGHIAAQSENLNALGLGVNRYGFSFHFKHYAKSDPADKPQWKDWGLELGNIQHPREVALLNTMFQNSGVYKLDKVNFLWTLRPGWQMRKPLALRQDRKAVGINAIGGAGLPLAYHWPVYVMVLQVDAGGNETFETVRYNPDLHPQSVIGGRASFATGISRGGIIPGLSLQGGLEFLWGNYRTDANIITIGTRLDAYSKKLPILHTSALNKSVFSTFYINFAIGLGS